MPDRDLAAYFAEAQQWDVDRAAQSVQQLRIAWTIATAGWIAVVAMSVALALITPLKTTEPYVIRVDNSTGIVDVVPVYAGKSDIGETVSRYLLTHYITVCEGFNFTSAERDYEECGAYNTSALNQAWYAQWNQSNPASPLNLYKDGTSIRAQVTAVTFFKKANGVTELAQVRYLRAQRPPAGTETVTHWIATVQYAYVPPANDVRMRQWNPLGFRVTDFHAEPESVAPETSRSPAPPTF